MEMQRFVGRQADQQAHDVRRQAPHIKDPPRQVSARMQHRSVDFTDFDPAIGRGSGLAQMYEACRAVAVVEIVGVDITDIDLTLEHLAAAGPTDPG